MEEAGEEGGRKKEGGKGSFSRKPVQVETVTEPVEDEKGRRVYHRKDKDKIKRISQVVAEERS